MKVICKPKESATGLEFTLADYLSTQRGGVGATQNAIGYQQANMGTLLINTQAAISAIEDADYAESMAEFTKCQIQTQASLAMLAQANQMSQQQVMTLFKGI